uniref:Uncharacterized protein n=1 Tax=Romanomermis culicivorax TaxID=13658 RepID=A0A915HU37_ROMCU
MEEAKKRMGEAKWNTLMEKVKEKNKKEEEEEERKANEGKESSEDGDDHDDNDGNKYGDGDGVEDPREQQEYDPREQQEDVPWNPNNIICPPDFAKRERYHLLVTIQPLPKQESLACLNAPLERGKWISC